MANNSENLEREAGRTRAQLAEALDALRARMTPGQVIDQLINYAREGPGAGSAATWRVRFARIRFRSFHRDRSILSFPAPTRSVWEESQHRWVSFGHELEHFAWAIPRPHRK